MPGTVNAGMEWNTRLENGKYVKMKDGNGKDISPNIWTWSPQGVINMHFPERWGYLSFADEEGHIKKADTNPEKKN